MAKRKRKKQSLAETCPFCKEGKVPDWKDWEELKMFTSPRGRILARRQTGVCAKHQRKLAKAIKRARFLGLLPFVAGVGKAKGID